MSQQGARESGEEHGAPARRGRAHGLLLLLGGTILGFLVALPFVLPPVLRHVAIARLAAITRRPVAIDALHLDFLKSGVTVRGVRVAERGGGPPLVDVDRLVLRLHLLSLLRGHVWIRELTVNGSTVRVVRGPTAFNVSDLVQSSGGGGGGFDVTVDRFVLTGGTVTLEDRALAEPRTWVSRDIRVEAYDVSTRRDDGRAVATGVTADAPVKLEITHLRLYPVHLQAAFTTSGLDLSLARLYLPPDAPVALTRGQASATLHVVLDAKGGVQAQASGEVVEATLMARGAREPLAVVPRLRLELRDLAVGDGRAHVGQLEATGSASVLDPRGRGAARFPLSAVHASLRDLTWPVVRPGQVDVRTSVPGGGTLAITGALSPPPAPSRLQLRLAGVELAAWSSMLPTRARVEGVLGADLRIHEPLAAGVPARIQGAVAVHRLGVGDGHRELVGARTIEASGLEVRWPARIVVGRLVVAGPRGLVERDATGGFPLRTVLMPPAASGGPAAPRRPATTASTSAPAVEIGEVVVQDGALAWRDRAVKCEAALDVSGIAARVTGIGWPLRGPLGVRAELRPPGGGEVRVSGRVRLEPFDAALHLTTRDADLSPYQAYVPTPARIAGRADVDLDLHLPSLSAESAGARGQVTLARVDIRDGERTIMRAERAAVTGLAVEWPRRVTAREVALRRPWILLERDDQGGLPLRTLLPAPSPAAPPAATATTRAGPVGPRGAGIGTEDVASGGRGAGTGAERRSVVTPVAAAETPRESDAPRSDSPGPPAAGESLAVSVSRVVIDDGGMRVVDRSISPPFAVDLQRLAVRAEGLATAPARPARLDVTGRVGPGSALDLHGTVGALGGPLQLDVNADVRGFWVPRSNPYVLQFLSWEVREGWLTTTLHCRIQHGTLDARTETRLRGLQVSRAGSGDQAQARIGLPLGLIVALMTDSHGDINIALPVRGRLSDPRFDLSTAIWSAVRTVAVKAISLPVSWIGRLTYGPDSRVERIDVDPIRFEPGTATITPEGREQVSRVAAFLGVTPEVRLELLPVVVPAAEGATDVGAARVKVVRALLDKAGVASARLVDGSPVPGHEPDDGRVELRVTAPGEGTPGPSGRRPLSGRG